jgi:hypothetical protein
MRFEGTLVPIATTASNFVQPGEKRPSGNTQKNTSMITQVTATIMRTGQIHAGSVSDSACIVDIIGYPAVPATSSISEVSSAMGSFDLRHIISSDTDRNANA